MTETTAPRKPRVLLVDDEPTVIRDAYQALARNYQVLQATRADRALTLVETMRPDLVLIDITLGDEDGYALADAIGKIANVPVAFLAVPSDDRAKGIELGALGFLSKPLDRERILQAVDSWLRRGQDTAAPATMTALRTDAIARIATVSAIDTGTGLKNVGGSQELYLSVLRSLCNSHATIATDLVTALEQGDRAAATMLSHTLKTILRTIGATELGEIAFGIEKSLKSGEGDTLSAPHLRARFERIVQDIRGAIFTEAPLVQP